MKIVGTTSLGVTFAIALASSVAMFGSASTADAGQTVYNFNNYHSSTYHVKKKKKPVPASYRSNRQKRDRYGARKRFGPESDRRWDGFRWSTPALYW